MSLIGLITGNKQEKKYMERARQAQDAALLKQQQLIQPFYDQGLKAFNTQALAINGGIDPNTGRQWSPATSPAFKWQQQQGEQALTRRLRSMGRLNSTFGDKAFTQHYNDLYGGEVDKQLGRLGSLASVGRGAATDLGNSYLGQGQNNANYHLGLGRLVQNNYNTVDEMLKQGAMAAGNAMAPGAGSAMGGGGGPTLAMNNQGGGLYDYSKAYGSQWG